MNGSHQMNLELNQDTGEVTPQYLSLNQVEHENQHELSHDDQSEPLSHENQSEPLSHERSK